MTSILNEQISIKYTQFNKIYEAVRYEKRETERNTYFSLLLDLQKTIDCMAKNASALPGKITSAAQLSQELSAKISTLFSMDVKETFFPPLPGSTTACLLQCVGFGNASANCWANALLQMFLHSPEGREVLLTVGRFYANGRNLDTPCIEKVVKLFKEGPISQLRLKDCLKLFDAIHSSFAKLQTLDKLIQAGRTDVASQLVPYLPRTHRERLTKIQDDSDLKSAIKALLKSEEPAEIRKQSHLRAAGLAFLSAMQYYDHAIKTAQETRQIPRPIPNRVSQDVRVAFHHLFGSFNHITHTEVFAERASAHEDAYEATQRLRGRYEEILRSENTFPPATYSLIESRRIYAPNGEPRALNPNKDYSSLEAGNISRKREHDYQILLEPATQNDLPIENLLAKYFRSPAVAGSEDAVYLHADGIHEQSYRLIEEQRNFQVPPKAITLVIKRFGVRMDGVPYKIQTRVMANRVITLPAEASPSNRALAYELVSFFVHRGTLGFGHYIAYRKMGETWVEFDDGKVRILSNAQIDAILHGRQGASITPYALDYRLVPDTKQDEMLKYAQTLIAPKSAPEESVPSKQRQLMGLLEKLQLQLKSSSTDRDIMETFQLIYALSPNCMKSLCGLIGIIEGMKDALDGIDLLKSNPKKIAGFTGSWIRASSDNIIGQLIQSEREKIAIRNCTEELSSMKEMFQSIPDLQKDLIPSIAKKEEELEMRTRQYRINNLRAYLSLLKDPSITVEQLRAIFLGLDIPKTLKESIYQRIEAVTGAPKDLADVGEKRFQADPRILLTPLKQIQQTAQDIDEEDDLSVLFPDLSLKTSSSPTILEASIDSLSK